MKNNQIQLLGLALVTSVGLTACSGLGKMVKKANTVSYEVTPKPLEMHGDSVAVSVSGKYPAKYFAKKAVLTVTPTIKYAGGEKALKPITLVGEKATANGVKINYKNGGSFSYTDKVPYTPEMRQAELMVKGSAGVKKKVKEIPAAKVADGTIVTPLLVKSDEKSLNGKDAFQKVVSVQSNGNIYFVINQAAVRPSEINGAEMKTMKEFIKTGAQKAYDFKGMSVSAYASPDGELTINENLATDRADNTIKAIKAEMKKLKISQADQEAFFTKATTAEDWDGFKKLMESSSIADKELILRVLSMYPDGETREREIKNLSKTYTEVADQILPKLRRSVMTLNADVKSRSDEQIMKLTTAAPDSLSVEEMLYATTLTQDQNTQLAILKTCESKYTSDWRASNNIGQIYLTQNKVADAQAQFEKANTLSANNPIVLNNLGIVSRLKGDRKAAADYYTKAMSAGPEVSYNMGIVNIMNGDYAGAVANFGNTNSFNAALAKVLAGSPDAALSTLDNSADKDAAIAYYLRAIIGARTGKTDLLTNSLRTAIQKDASLKQMAATDAEFLKVKDNADFKALIQ